MQDAELDPLLLIPIFILDFLCIHPFNDGNGRMSRLLTLLLLYRSGYIVGKYISIEKLISDTKETYYEALQASSYNWHEGTNDYAPFVTYMLGVLVAAYRDFESRIELLTTKGLSKPDRVREIIKNHLGKITKSEIMDALPGYQSDHRPAGTGRAAEIWRDHQTRRWPLHILHLEQGERINDYRRTEK